MGTGGMGWEGILSGKEQRLSGIRAAEGHELSGGGDCWSVRAASEPSVRERFCCCCCCSPRVVSALAIGNAALALSDPVTVTRWPTEEVRELSSVSPLAVARCERALDEA